MPLFLVKVVNYEKLFKSTIANCNLFYFICAIILNEMFEQYPSAIVGYKWWLTLWFLWPNLVSIRESFCCETNKFLTVIGVPGFTRKYQAPHSSGIFNNWKCEIQRWSCWLVEKGQSHHVCYCSLNILIVWNSMELGMLVFIW